MPSRWRRPGLRRSSGMCERRQSLATAPAIRQGRFADLPYATAQSMSVTEDTPISRTRLSWLPSASVASFTRMKVSVP